VVLLGLGLGLRFTPRPGNHTAVRRAWYQDLEFPSAWGEGNQADLDLIGAEASDHLWRHITGKAERFPSPVIGTATLAVKTGIWARAGTVIVRK
jgi:hypothetical protein